MNLKEAKAKFIETWGALGSQWGINRTMAVIHALLLTAEKPLSTEDIMEQLKVSRGNSNMNVRALINWGLVHKIVMPGERMEFFEAEKDIHKVATLILRERRRQEIEPVRRVISDLKKVNDKSKSGKNFNTLMHDIDGYVKLADNVIEKAIQMDENWLTKTLKKVIIGK